MFSMVMISAAKNLEYSVEGGYKGGYKSTTNKIHNDEEHLNTKEVAYSITSSVYKSIFSNDST